MLVYRRVCDAGATPSAEAWPCSQPSRVAEAILIAGPAGWPAAWVSSELHAFNLGILTHAHGLYFWAVLRLTVGSVASSGYETCILSALGQRRILCFKEADMGAILCAACPLASGSYAASWPVLAVGVVPSTGASMHCWGVSSVAVVPRRLWPWVASSRSS